MTAKFSRRTPGFFPSDDAPSIQDTPQEASALAVSAAGVFFELVEIPGQQHGPAPWSIGLYATAPLALAAGFAPQAGDRLLVVFAGVGIESPWVVGWTR